MAQGCRRRRTGLLDYYLHLAGLLLAGLLACPLPVNAQLVQPTITTIAGGGSPASGNGDGGAASKARLTEPVGIAVDAGGNVYVAERGLFTVRKINPAGVITTVAGNGTQLYNGDGIPAISAGIDVRGIAVDAAGNLYVADGSNRRVRKVSPDGAISTIARTGLNFPSRVAVDGYGAVHVIDNTRVLRIGAGGAVQVVAGNGGYGTAGDGGPATQAQLANPTAIAFDKAGRLYIAGGERVRRVDTNGVISTVAGGGHFKIDPVATNYRWMFPYGVALDSRGNLYVASGNNLVRMVNSDGIAGDAAGQILLEFGDVAGAPFGFGGDGGPATAAKLYEPEAVAIDGLDNLYIADTRNNRIRKVTPVPTPRIPIGVEAFAPYRTYPVGSWGWAAAIADVTGDGRDDALMLTNGWGPGYEEPANDNRLNLFVQNPDGTLAAAKKYAHNDDASLASTSAIATGDLNGDGRADVVVGMHDGIQIYLGRADGLVRGVASAGLPHAQAVAQLVILDVNGDGKLDIVALGGGRAEGGSYPDDLYGFIHFYGDGVGGVGSKLFVSMEGGRNWGSLVAHDLNGDGSKDLMGSWSDMYQTPDGMWHYRAGIAWKLRLPGGGFAPAKFASIEDAYNSAASFAVGDFNGDGRKDVVMARDSNAPQAFYSMLTQDAAGDFNEVRRWQAYDAPHLLVAADMNQDGVDDLLVAHSGWHAIGFHPGDWQGLDVEVKYFVDESSNQALPGLAVGDLNGDGCKDVAMGDRNYGMVVLTGVRCIIGEQGRQPLLPPKPIQAVMVPRQLLNSVVNGVVEPSRMAAWLPSQIRPLAWVLFATVAGFGLLAFVRWRR